MTEVSTTICDEIVLRVTGDVDPGEPQTRNDPGYDAFVDSLWLDRVFVNDKDIFEGVDMKGPAVKRIVENIAFAVYNHAESALINEYSDGLV